MPEKRKLLVVDDEIANLQKLKRTFLDDFEVHEATSGEEALALLKDLPFSVVITDQRMPGMSGVDLLRESLRLESRATRIILTGFTEVDDLMDAINQGHVDCYVTKPWDPFSLKRTVKQELERQELKRENQLLGEQLRIAKEVQEQLFLQSLPPLKTLDYYGVCRAARGVGGDYYDFLKTREDRLCIALGDVSGKGISAALLMASLQALFRSHAPMSRDAMNRLVVDINRVLCSSTDGSKFATFFCGIYDDSNRTLTYVNAGHNPPMWFQRGRLAAGSDSTSSGDPASDSVKTGGTARLQTGGVVLGLFPEAEFTCEQIRLQPGDLLLAFTDGITEAFNASDEPFGEERLEDLVRRNAQLSPTELCHAILEEIAHFVGDVPPHDDLTLLVAKVE